MCVSLAQYAVQYCAGWNAAEKLLFEGREEEFVIRPVTLPSAGGSIPIEYRTEFPFFSVSANDRCHVMSWRMQALYAINLLCSAT